jgi:hypothetical protein
VFEPATLKTWTEREELAVFCQLTLALALKRVGNVGQLSNVIAKVIKVFIVASLCNLK